MNDQKHQQQHQRDRTNTIYYDAQTNFGTPPSSEGIGGEFKMTMRKASGDEDVLYERVHTERRQHHSSSSAGQPQYRRASDAPHDSSPSVVRSPVVIHPIRGSPATQPVVMMAPMTTSYDYSIGSSSPFRAASGADEPSRRWHGGKQQNHLGHEDFRPGSRANSAANIDALFAPKKSSRSHSSSSGVVPPPSSRIGAYADQAYSRRLNEATNTPNRDYGVVGAYSSDGQMLFGRQQNQRDGGSIRVHSNDYELDPRLNVTYPQFYVDDWKERHSHQNRDTSHGYSRAPRQSPSFSTASGAPGAQTNVGRPRFASDAHSRHLYEEVPMGSPVPPHSSNITAAAAPGYRILSTSGAVASVGGAHGAIYARSARGSGGGGGTKETAIIDDYDNVPNEFIVAENGRPHGQAQMGGADEDGESAIYQPGRYQPSEDAGSSSDEDDPEYLELMERDSIINRYEKGPDAADVDAWENPNFELYTNLDRFGFVHKKGDKTDEPTDLQKRRILKELGREKKWLKMIEVWKSGGPSKKMEDRIWKGIPEKLRIVVWPRLLGAERMKHEKRDVYSELLLRARLVSKDIKQIDLDINRTYRDHLAFRKRYDVKQKSLLNVLAAYSMYNTEVGYCQGMSQIAALFLMYLDEEDAFWSLHQLMVSPKHTMHGFFVPGFPKLQRFEEHFKRILKKYKPRIYKYLEKQDIPYIYLTKWWFGCFLDRVPFSLALRLWDAFLVEGDPILIAMAFNIMKMHEKSIRKHTMESFMEFIQNDIALDFGYSDDEVMHSLRETLTKLKSDRQHVPPPPRPEDLSEVPTKALGPILHKPMASIREEIHEIQSRRSRANSTGRSPHPKRKESARGASKGPPPVQHKWNGNASQDSIIANGREVPFEIPTRRITGSPSSSATVAATAEYGSHAMTNNGQSSHLPPSSSSSSSKPRDFNTSANTPTAASRHHHHHPSQTRAAAGSVTPSTQRLRDERNGQMVLLSRASDSEGDVCSPSTNTRDSDWSHSHQISTASSKITHSGNNITRIELDGDVSVI